jgi:phenylalanyl-tRNA synthetase beta chain
MKASINWLKEFVDFSLTPSEIADALTMTGMEVEGVEGLKDDSILEITVTPNRPDCLSIRGLAREISAILGLPFQDRSASIQEEKGVRPHIEIRDTDLCSRYTSRIIRGVRVGPSPEWLSHRLEYHGMRPTNNIVDVTNYVLLEMGHPLHAFDLDRLEGVRIVVRTANSEKTMKTLDNEKRTLNKDMLLIWDAKKPVAIAGVMGGLNTEVTHSTVNVLLESAYFDQRSVRRTAKSLNLATEASYRFERGADIKLTSAALDRVAELIMETAGGEVTKTTDIYTKPFSPMSITVRPKKINEIIGVKINTTQVLDILTRLEIESREEGENIVVTPPSFREDIQRDTDVIEEIARLYGYDKIPSTLPCVTMQPVRENPVWKLMKVVKETMRKAGYSEAINYSFLNPLELDRLRIQSDDRRRSLVTVRNPLKKEEEALRTTLIPALINNVKFNMNRGVCSLRFFEVASVFIDTGQKLPDEVLKLSAVRVKEDRADLWESTHSGFYDIKGAAENLFLELGIKDYIFMHEPGESEPYLHPGKSCVITSDNQKIGVLGALHPEVLRNFDINTEIYFFELDIDSLFAVLPSKTAFSPLPKFPFVERDLAIILSEDVTAAAVEDIIHGMKSDMIESVTLFDIYTGKSIPEGKKSLAFSIRYRAGDRTLTDSEVNEMHAQILKKLEESLQAELRS